MTSFLRTAAATTLVLSLGLVGQAQARSHASGTTPPSTSNTVMGLSVPR